MSGHHEVVEAFGARDLGLSADLEAMLDEHPEHRSERRGCGFTQATRYLAERINRPRAEADLEDLTLFADWHGADGVAAVRRAVASNGLDDWRGLDRCAPLPDDEVLQREAARQACLRALPEALEQPESALIAAMIRDIVLPRDPAPPGEAAVHTWPEKLEVGSCPTAEKCFLELAHGFMPRNGRANRLVDGQGRTLLVEKMNMGDNHSCVSLEPLWVNGVPVPAGSLFAAHYDVDAVPREAAEGPLPGDRIPVSACAGLRFLRLTTLALAPSERPRAFSVHFEAQQRAGLFEPETTRLAQLRGMIQGEGD